MVIDLRSDTVTKPTSAMRRAMAEAEVGDDVLDGDPTVERLQTRVAAMLGKEVGLFFPTGSMANQAAIAAQTMPGTEVLLDADAHIIHWEMAGAAVISGVQIRPVVPEPGRLVMHADDLRRALRPASKHAPLPGIVCLENTHNGAGGKITSLEELRALRAVADEHHLPVHLDGARLWNASAATATTLASFASCANTVMLSFAKGLGCPVGAMLVGDAPTMARAHRIRKRLGGGMRQSGILAAAALYALDAHLERLTDDHTNARRFADEVAGADGAVVVPPDTNIVMVDVPTTIDCAEVIERAKANGVLLSPWKVSRFRAVAHMDVDAAAVARAAAIVRAAIESCVVAGGALR